MNTFFALIAIIAAVSGLELPAKITTTNPIEDEETTLVDLSYSGDEMPSLMDI
jgi:hypothetical protein